MIDQSFTPHQVASQLAISPATVRRWCADHAAYLSPSANPDKGIFRHLSQGDIEVLQEVKKLRSAGLSPAATNDKLSETVFAAPGVEGSHASQASPSAAQTALIVVEAMQIALAPLTGQVEAMESRLQRMEERTDERTDDRFNTKERLLALERRLQPFESQRQRVDVVFLVVMAFVAGVLVGLAVWWVQ